MPKYRRPLNDKQLLILKVIYKFRFVTVELMTGNKRTTSYQAIHNRLKVLLEQEYIAKRYDRSDRQQNKPATYCLAPTGIKTLRDLNTLNPSVLHATYRDRTASTEFIDHCLHIFQIYRQIEKLYPGHYSFLTKSETSGYDYYPKRLPDIHLQAKGSGTDYFMDIIEPETRPIAIRQKLTGYSSHSDEGEWEEATGNDYAHILLVCTSPSIERSMQRRAARWLNTEELTAYTTSYKALVDSESAKDKIWSDVDEPDELVDLR